MNLLIKNYYKNGKKNVPYLIIIFFVITIISFLIMILNYMKYNFETKVMNNVLNKKIILNVNQVEKEIVNSILENNKEYILETFDFFDDIWIWYTEEEAYSAKCISDIEIKEITSLNTKIDINEIVVSSRLLENSYNINDTIELYRGDHKYRFKIIASYDDKVSSTIYINCETLKNIYLKENLTQKKLQGIIISDYNNMRRISALLENEKVEITYFYDSAVIAGYNKIMPYYIVGSIFLILLLIILYLNILKNLFKKDKLNIMTLNYVGFSKFDLNKLIYFRNLYFNTIIVIMQLLIYAIVSLFTLKKDTNIWQFLLVKVINNFCIIIIITLILSFLSFIYNRKLLKKALNTN